MTAVATGSIRARAVPSSGPSISRLNDLTMNITDVPQTISPNSFCVYVGKSSTRPTTFAGLTTPALVDGVDNLTAFSYQSIVGGMRMSVADVADLSGFTLGDHLWACVFAGLTASGTAAVLASIDLGLVAA